MAIKNTLLGGTDWNTGDSGDTVTDGFNDTFDELYTRLKFN